MRMIHHRRIFTFILPLVVLAAYAVEFSQDKPKLKDFGSSLKKLKWDPTKKATTEIPTENKGKVDDDVIRVETRLVVADVLTM